MIEFDQFVTSLGLHADNYSKEQLRQLHRDVGVFAKFVVVVMRARSAQATQEFELDSLRQPPLDFSNAVRQLPTTAPRDSERIG